MSEREHGRTALVLAGGGSLGAVQVGMLQALIEHGFHAELVVGASVGAINGAYFAARPHRHGVEELADIWLSLRSEDVFPIHTFSALKSLLLGQNHLVPADALAHLLERRLPVARIEDTQLPLHIVATELLTGREAVLSAGPLLEALLASAAIPLVYPHREVAGKALVDGSVASNTPIASAVALGAKRLLVLPTGFGCACPAVPASMASLALHTLNLLSMWQLVRDVEHYQHQADIHVVAPLCPQAVSVFDFSVTAGLIRRARLHTQRWLREGGLNRTGVPDSLRPHHHGAGIQ
ncbi:patatin-like phospholipase family protein [Oceanimonas pelagia]|uniref:Patatin-like phospholipase family protein n=1 Tax=Oceanimonas pelagia TaxID=3028314 RepID=A0AA50KS35_9GAMM|nr:patatin-like phospholipase family protein [Oceanimonas pelagia]WMC12065.1 patatin-like phospholipase family protein [Oceanimonas pelagia]